MSSITAIVIEKNGNIKEVLLKDVDEETFYKKAGFKTKEGFSCHTQWTVNDLKDTSFTVSVYGKTTGRANQENKYEFPPPIDNTLFFGNCLLVNQANGNLANLVKKDWEAIYDYLYGGFADIGEEDSECSEDDEEDDRPRTKNGYVKDGFVVDDDEEEEEEASEEEEEEEDEVSEEEERRPKRKPRENKKTKAEPKRGKKTTKLMQTTNQPVEESYLDCTSELSEESYV